METYPAYHLSTLTHADAYFGVDTDARVRLNDVLETDGIPVWDRLKFFVDNANRDVLDRFVERVAQIHPEVGHISDAEEIVDAFIARSRKRGSCEFVNDEALFREKSQAAVTQAVAEAGMAELLAIAVLATYSVEEDASERRYRERCERERASES